MNEINSSNLETLSSTLLRQLSHFTREVEALILQGQNQARYVPYDQKSLQELQEEVEAIFQKATILDNEMALFQRENHQYIAILEIETSFQSIHNIVQRFLKK